MNARLLASLLALAAPAAAFVPSPSRPAPATALSNNLRDMAAYPDQQRQMGDFEAFDRNGAFSRSPRGGMGGRMDMMGGPRGGDRMYTQDGFDPYSAYGGNFGSGSQSQMRGGMPYGEPMMMGPGMMMNGARADNTMGGFSYSSRVRGYGAGRPFEDEYMGFDGPMGPMGGMDFDEGYGGPGGYGGFDGPSGDMSRMGP